MLPRLDNTLTFNILTHKTTCYDLSNEKFVKTIPRVCEFCFLKITGCDELSCVEAWDFALST
jgi:hypothetical protein